MFRLYDSLNKKSLAMGGVLYWSNDQVCFPSSDYHKSTRFADVVMGDYLYHWGKLII